MPAKRIGVWLIGALGSISSSVMLGAFALARGLTDSTGMITATEPFQGLGLLPVQAMEFGGCDVRELSLREAVRHAAGEAINIDRSEYNELNDFLDEIEEHIAPGCTVNCGEAVGQIACGKNRGGKGIRDEIAYVGECLERFKTSRKLDDIVVVNLASTEPALELTASHKDLAALETCLDQNCEDHVRASTIYAYAAIQGGYPYINFTPSNGALFPAMVELADRKGVPVMGNDGKTGETLVKSALAHMFICRNLQVLSWEGFNILGNLDGRVLEHPENKKSKTQSKDAVLGQILGYKPHSHIAINYVPSLSDQKIAWDFIHFKGFLGSKMSLQFVWQGFDSLLAAPLILDLVRLAEFAKRNGQAGLMPHLACFFKSPLGVNEHGLYEQFQMLTDYVTPSEARKNG